MTKDKAGISDKEHARRKPLVETIIGILSGILVITLVIFLGFQAITGDKRPPDLVTQAQSAKRLGGKTLLRVKIINRGERAAAAVTIRAELAKGPGREIILDYIAAGSSRSGAFFFDNPDVTIHDVRLSVYGFIEP